MVEHQIVARAEDAPHVLIGARVQADAIRADAKACLLLHRMLGVEHEIFTIVHIDVVPVEASAFADVEFGIHNGGGG